jgi:hypothetical protein
MSTLTRRSLVASTAALPALALPAAAAEPDPIFAAIEWHREAAIRQMRASRATFDLEHGDPAIEAADEFEDRARNGRNEAEHALFNTQPTTLAGVVALLAYADGLHIGAVALPEDPSNWNIDAESLGVWSDEQIVDSFDGKRIELPFAFWIMRNVRASIERLARA